MSEVFWNGQFIDEAQACLPLTDPAFLYGLGTFTTLKIVQGIPEYLELHLERLEQQCTALGLPKPKIQSQTVQDFIALRGASDGLWRLKIIVTTHHIGMTLQPYIPTQVQSYRLCVYPEPVMRPTARLKSLSYLDRWWIKDYAQKQGCDEALVVDAAGHVLETAFGNIYWTLGDVVYTPDFSLPLLKGIALQVILSQHKEVKQVQQTLAEIPTSACLFVCNALAGSIPVHEVDGRKFNITLAYGAVQK